jgi:hypothetical protein
LHIGHSPVFREPGSFRAIGQEWSVFASALTQPACATTEQLFNAARRQLRCHNADLGETGRP